MSKALKSRSILGDLILLTASNILGSRIIIFVSLAELCFAVILSFLAADWLSFVTCIAAGERVLCNMFYLGYFCFCKNLTQLKVRI